MREYPKIGASSRGGAVKMTATQRFVLAVARIIAKFVTDLIRLVGWVIVIIVLAYLAPHVIPYLHFPF